MGFWKRVIGSAALAVIGMGSLLADTAPRHDAQGAKTPSESRYTLQEVLSLPETLPDASITVTDCLFFYGGASQIACVSEDRAVTGFLWLDGALSDDDRARVVEYCHDPKHEACRAEVTGEIVDRPKDPYNRHMRKATIRWQVPAPRQTPPSDGNTPLTITQFLIAYPHRIGQKVAIDGCYLRIDPFEDALFCLGEDIPRNYRIALDRRMFSEDDERWLSSHCLSGLAPECRVAIEGIVMATRATVALRNATVTTWHQRQPSASLDARNMALLDLLIVGQYHVGAKVTVRDCRIVVVQDNAYYCRGTADLGVIEVIVAAPAEADKARIAAECAEDEQTQDRCLVAVSGTYGMTKDGMMQLKDATVHSGSHDFP